MMTLRERFDEKWMPEPNSGCWLWLSAVDDHGYARISVDNRNTKASRVSYALFKGPVPDGLLVCHRCDTPACVNPDHLLLGTHKSNVDDCTRRGRHVAPRGERAPTAKLTTKNVAFIRQTTISVRRLAAMFDVSENTIRRTRKRIWWRHC